MVMRWHTYTIQLCGEKTCASSDQQVGKKKGGVAQAK